VQAEARNQVSSEPDSAVSAVSPGHFKRELDHEDSAPIAGKSIAPRLQLQLAGMIDLTSGKGLLGPDLHAAHPSLRTAELPPRSSQSNNNEMNSDKSRRIHSSEKDSKPCVPSSLPFCGYLACSIELQGKIPQASHGMETAEWMR